MYIIYVIKEPNYTLCASFIESKERVMRDFSILNSTFISRDHRKNGSLNFQESKNYWVARFVLKIHVPVDVPRV